MKTLIFNATVVDEGESFVGSVVIENEIISEIYRDSKLPDGNYDKKIDATGCYLLPGIIDDHVHFREPGLTDKADIESESRAAAVGGVTSYFDMPNTVPQTVTIDNLNSKFDIAKTKSHINYSFFFGATNNNSQQFGLLDKHRIPGIKMFMGASTGNMLVDKDDALENIFREVDMPLMVHCEDTDVINRNMSAAKLKYGIDPDVKYHPLIRSDEACYQSTHKAVSLAKKYGTRLHVAHISTARELDLFTPYDKQITAEAVIGHLYFCDDDYNRLGSLIKVNPSIKTKHDRDELRRALTDGRISVIGTDHAPHRIENKQGGAAKASSGMPMIQFSLVSMLELVDAGVLGIESMVQLMCHNPASLFHVRERGYIRKGYKADMVIVKPHKPWTVSNACIESKCGWSPMTGHEYQWQVQCTLCNGHLVYSNENHFIDYCGEELTFN